MLTEINNRKARRRRPLEAGILKQLSIVSLRVDNGLPLDKNESLFITQLHERMTEPGRIKW